MNKTKRNLELASAIVSIVLSSILAFMFLICLASTNLVRDLLVEQYSSQLSTTELETLLNMVNMVFIIGIIIFVAMIIMGAFLATNPMKHGTIRKRTGLGITFVIFNGLIALYLLTSSPFFGLLYAVPFGLGLASVCMKHNTIDIYTDIPLDF